MKVLFRLLSLALLSICATFASADTADFKMDVLDPPSLNGSFPTFVITQSPFQIIFSACQPGELPNGLTASGCFAGVNRTGTDWTSIAFTFPNTSALGSQPVDCSPAASDNIFQSSSCDLNNGTVYGLEYANGVLHNNDFFFVTETGVDPALFPIGTATVTSTVTPEPTSLLLLSTGLGCGLLAWKIRA